MPRMTKLLALAGLAAALTATPHTQAKAACSLTVSPVVNNVCQQEDEELPGYGLLSCARPRNADQRTFCAAVYGYESHWCERIGNPTLRHECLNRTE